MKKQLKIVVLAKQVPDTRNVGKDAMTPEGTVNRAALPAIFNPEDLNALEAALFLKDETEGSTVHILTMGPPRAADIIRDAIFRGADGGYLLTDRKFAGSDTLATSYALSCALRKIQPDVIVAGRVMKFKNAMTASEIAAEPTSEAAKMAASKPYLQIFEWSAADVDPDDNQLGLTGSPTKVKKIENVVFQAKEAKKLTADDKQIEELMVELIASHTLG